MAQMQAELNRVEEQATRLIEKLERRVAALEQAVLELSRAVRPLDARDYACINPEQAWIDAQKAAETTGEAAPPDKEKVSSA